MMISGCASVIGSAQASNEANNSAQGRSSATIRVAFELRVFVEAKPLLLRLRQLPRRGELSRVTVGSLDAAFREPFLAAARVSFGEFDRHILGLGRRACRRRFPRTGLKRNRLWRPWRAPASLFSFCSDARVRYSIEDRPRTGPDVLGVWQASGAKRRALGSRRRLFSGRAPEAVKIVGYRKRFHPFAP